MPRTKAPAPAPRRTLQPDNSDWARAMRMLAASRPAERHLLTFDAAADLLSISRESVQRLVDRGELPSVHLGSRHMIARASLEAFVARLIAEGSIAISKEDVA